jgi:anti-anti-sigma factor
MSNKHGSHWLEREDFGGVTVVRLKPPQAPDDDTIRAVFEPIFSLVGEVGRNQLVLNFAAVGHLPSLAVGKLVMLNRKVQAAEGRLDLCQLTPAVTGTLESTRLTELFTIYGTEEEAVKSLS